MIVLDTNVVSEAMKPDPDAGVREWLNEQAAETLFLSTVTLAELLYGIATLPAGRRKSRLAASVESLVALFDERVLAFDVAAARRHSELAVRARKAGMGFPTPDGYIAAIAASRGFSVASRDTAPFKAAGVDVINPWSARP